MGLRQWAGTGEAFRPGAINCDIPRQTIPTQLSTVTNISFILFYLEVANNTGGAVNVTVYDAAGLPLTPTQSVQNGNLLTYRSDYGTPMAGLSWQASAPGLVGWFCGAL